MDRSYAYTNCITTKCIQSSLLTNISIPYSQNYIAPPSISLLYTLNKIDDIDPTIVSYYLSKREGGGNIYKLWDEGADVGPSMTPSAYCERYRDFMVQILKNLSPNKSAHYFSIGSGPGKVEELLHKDGYDILCSDIFNEAIELLHRKGLKAILASGLNLPDSIEDNSFDIIYIDGSLSHMSNSFTPPINQPFQKPLLEVTKKLTSNGVLVLSDDPPSNDKAFQINPRVNALRVNEEIMVNELKSLGFEIDKIYYIPYERPTVGIVKRRIIVAKKLPNSLEILKHTNLTTLSN